MTLKSLTYSLLIPTCNRPKLLMRLLDSVLQQNRLPLEVIIIDQSDDLETQQAFNNWNPPQIQKKYIHRKIKSLILARNAGLDLCGNTDLVAFFDDDIFLKPHFCENLIQIFENDIQGEYAGGMGTIEGAIYPRKPFQRFFLMPHEGGGQFLASGSPTFPHWKKEFAHTEFLSGGLTFWRRKIIREFRYDERIAGYGHGDDVDVSYRISRHYKLFIEPKAICHHDPHAPGRDRRRVYRRAWIQNMYYLAIKNGFSLLAFGWCVLGHLLRDVICRDFQGVLGDLQGMLNILRGHLDTVVGFKEFIHQKNAKLVS